MPIKLEEFYNKSEFELYTYGGTVGLLYKILKDDNLAYTISELADKTNKSPSSINNALHKLTQQKKIIRKGSYFGLSNNKK